MRTETLHNGQVLVVVLGGAGDTVEVSRAGEMLNTSFEASPATIIVGVREDTEQLKTAGKPPSMGFSRLAPSLIARKPARDCASLQALACLWSPSGRPRSLRVNLFTEVSRRSQLKRVDHIVSLVQRSESIRSAYHHGAFAITKDAWRALGGFRPDADASLAFIEMLEANRRMRVCDQSIQGSLGELRGS